MVPIPMFESPNFHGRGWSQMIGLHDLEYALTDFPISITDVTSNWQLEASDSLLGL
jgi:hypothetical protein